MRTPGQLSPVFFDEDRFSQLDDYAVVKRLIAHLHENWRAQPSLEEIAAYADLSPTECHKLFRRWAGITPKQFVQALTIDHAKKMLRRSASIMETSYESGLSGPGRLHDLFVDFESVTPGNYKRKGEGLQIALGVHASPFGLAVGAATDHGLCGLAFCDGKADLSNTMQDLKARWPKADFYDKPERIAPYVQKIFSPQRWNSEKPVRLVLIGSDFDISVWQHLLKIPSGSATTYSDIASNIGSPNSARAVGNAVGRNPLAFVVPCHRVLRKDGAIGGYHWGVTRKHALIGWEVGHLKV